MLFYYFSFMFLFFLFFIAWLLKTIVLYEVEAFVFIVNVSTMEPFTVVSYSVST